MILLSVKQQFFILVFVSDHELGTKWLYNWSTGLVIGEFCNILEPDPLTGVRGPTLAKQLAHNSKQLNLKSSFLPVAFLPLSIDFRDYFDFNEKQHRPGHLNPASDARVGDTQAPSERDACSCCQLSSYFAF